jgi:hypothetical protein
MKALTKITLADGSEIRVPHPLDEMVTIWAQMHRATPGSVFAIDRLTDHGTLKRTALLAGTIVRVDEL